MGLSYSTERTRGANVQSGSLTGKIVDVTFDSSYASGGEALAPSAFGLRSLVSVQVVGGNAAAGGYHFHWDNVNGKLMAFRSPAGSVTGNVTVGGGTAGEPLGITPDSNAGALTKNAATARTIPIATFLGAAPAIAAAALGEVTSAVDLSAVTVRLMGLGLS